MRTDGSERAERTERRLAAILSADAAGYSRLMSDDDEGTVRTLQERRGRIRRLVDDFRGRVVDAPGDNLLAEFPSAVGAVRCAVEIQRALAEANEGLDPDRQLVFRIGIHLGDVLVEGGGIFGDGVNVAARLERLAEPGGICLSDLVYQQVRRKLDLPATDLGEQSLKNLDEPVRAYRVQPGRGEASAVRAASRPALTPPDQPSLAVLPFVNMSGDPAQEYFNDGLSDDIMTELARIPGLFLISHASMMTYKKTAARPVDVARELGVRHVLEGGVRTSQNRARIHARLVEGATGRIVWAERFDRELEDVFAVQDEIVDEVVTALDVTLVGGESARTLRKHLRNPRALGLLYRASHLTERFNREDMEEARSLYEEVVRLEPESPMAYMCNAWTYYFEVERGWSEAPERTLDQMAALAHRALELGDVSGYASLMLAHMHLMRREYDEALDASERALAERPSCQGAYGLRANILNYCGLPDAAIPLAKQAIRLSPVAQTFIPEVLATAHYLRGDLEQAIESAHATLAQAPDNANARLVLVAALVETGRLEAARDAAREVPSVDPGFTLQRFARCHPHRDRAPLDRLLHSLARAGLGDTDAAGATPQIDLAPPHASSRRRVAPRPRR